MPLNLTDFETGASGPTQKGRSIQAKHQNGVLRRAVFGQSAAP